jgi:formylglycine-generating enzyme required for sulfatase activity
MNTKTIAFAMVFAAGSLLAGEATVTNVAVQQRWPWSQKVDIDYTLDCDDNDLMDVSVSLYDGDTPLTASILAFSGDVQGVPRGRRRITFDPTVAGLAAGTYSSVRAELSARPAALYLIVDLTKTKGDAGVVTYLTKADLVSGAYGTVVTNPVSGIDSIAWTGVTNDSTYATTKYVMRRISAGTFMMGANNKTYNKDYNVRTNSVTLTRDFYIGVFETTQRQWELVMGANPSYFKTNGSTRPVEGITYAAVRGKTADWPSDGYGKADEGSFLQKMCDLTGLVFDLPTFAQWQYASGYTLSKWYNTGKTPPPAEWQAGPAADECSRYSNNSGASIPTGAGVNYADYDVDRATAKVGSYLCNAFGLYDMHGNVWEFLLDYDDGSYDYPEVCTDPVGPETGSYRMWGGGSFCRNGQYIRLAFRGEYSIPLESKNETYLRESGFRAIVMP